MFRDHVGRVLARDAVHRFQALLKAALHNQVRQPAGDDGVLRSFRLRPHAHLARQPFILWARTLTVKNEDVAACTRATPSTMGRLDRQWRGVRPFRLESN